MSRMTVRLASIAALELAAMTVAAPAWPHHSFAMFDATKPLTLKGTVREFQWTNPRCFVQLVVASPGGATEWSLEMNSPTESCRSGWRPRTYQAGDELTVVVHPLRDGKPGGQLVSATDAGARRTVGLRGGESQSGVGVDPGTSPPRSRHAFSAAGAAACSCRR